MAKPKQSKRGKKHEAPIESAIVAETVPHPEADEAQRPTESADLAADIVGDAAPAGEPRADAEADVWAQDRAEGIEEVSSEPEEGAADRAVWAESAEGANPAEGGETPDGEVALAGDETAEEAPVVLDATHMEAIIESLLFASDKVLGLAELKRLLGERDGKKVTAAVEALLERRKGSGIEVMRAANGWHLRTNPRARALGVQVAGRQTHAPVARHDGNPGHCGLPPAMYPARDRPDPRRGLRAGAEDLARPRV